VIHSFLRCPSQHRRMSQVERAWYYSQAAAPSNLCKLTASVLSERFFLFFYLRSFESCLSAFNSAAVFLVADVHVPNISKVFAARKDSVKTNVEILRLGIVIVQCSPQIHCILKRQIIVEAEEPRLSSLQSFGWFSIAPRIPRADVSIEPS
jgi:hypothetical protein